MYNTHFKDFLKTAPYYFKYVYPFTIMAGVN